MQFIPWLFLIVQAGIVVASLLGYGIFTSRPDLLAQVDPQARFFTWAFHGFAVGNMLFGGLADGRVTFVTVSEQSWPSPLSTLSV